MILSKVTEQCLSQLKMSKENGVRGKEQRAERESVREAEDFSFLLKKVLTSSTFSSSV